jgi:hypothetical protein
MTALEDRIRAGLNADRPVPDLWEAVQSGARRRRAVRTATTTAAVAAVAVAILAGVATFSLSGDRSGQPTGPSADELAQQLLDPDAWNGPTARFLDGATPTASDLVGLWRIRGSDDAWLMLLSADGYWTTTNGWDLFGGGAVGNRGTWSLDAGRMTLRGKEGFLGNGFKAVLDGALMPDGSLHQVTRPSEGRCGTGVRCSPQRVPERFLYDRVVPGPSRLLRILTSAPATPLPSDANHAFLPGVWVTPDSEWVVTVSPEGQFRAFRGSGDPRNAPDDAGHVDIDAQGHLTMACRNGAVSADVVLARTEVVEGLLPSGVRMQPSSVEGSCPSGLGTTLAWIRVSERE